jgi:hypothetical protein
VPSYALIGLQLGTWWLSRHLVTNTANNRLYYLAGCVGAIPGCIWMAGLRVSSCIMLTRPKTHNSLMLIKCMQLRLQTRQATMWHWLARKQ